MGEMKYIPRLFGAVPRETVRGFAATHASPNGPAILVFNKMIRRTGSSVDRKFIVSCITLIVIMFQL